MAKICRFTSINPHCAALASQRVLFALALIPFWQVRSCAQTGAWTAWPTPVPPWAGDDATEAVLQIYSILDRSDVNVLLFGGAAISWFNIIDLDLIFERVHKPLVCLTYEESPGLEEYIHEYFPQPEEKLRRYARLGARVSVRLKTGFEVYVRVLGMTADEARILLNKFTLDGRVPEPVRVARLAARAALHACEENR